MLSFSHAIYLFYYHFYYYYYFNSSLSSCITPKPMNSHSNEIPHQRIPISMNPQSYDFLLQWIPKQWIPISTNELLNWITKFKVSVKLVWTLRLIKNVFLLFQTHEFDDFKWHQNIIIITFNLWVNFEFKKHLNESQT